MYKRQVKEPKRHPSEHITVTVVVYHVVEGGVPSEEDVLAAIDDLEALYASCEWTGRLADDGASFMKKELTVPQLLGILDKVTLQPAGQGPGPSNRDEGQDPPPPYTP